MSHDTTHPTTLTWGHRYLATEPDHFRVDYSIHPFMHLDDQPDPTRTREQWLAMVAAVEAAGGSVEVSAQLLEAPDMVYAMNLGLPLLRVGAHLEAGDAFAFRGELVVGCGPRTEELALKHLASDLQIGVRGFRITHPGMYHMDLGFWPLDDTRAMVCPAAYDDVSAAALLDLCPSRWCSPRSRR